MRRFRWYRDFVVFLCWLWFGHSYTNIDREYNIMVCRYCGQPDKLEE